MGKGFKHGAGGGNPLNFKVVGGTSAPASPKENMIWVNTDVEITSWIFSATEPETPVEGMVWFFVGVASSGAFNALKKNTIMVCPLSAKQYASGAWVNKSAQNYQGGEWVDWILWLYNEGDECTDITGGYVAQAKAIASWATGAIAPAITDNGTSVTIKQTGNGNGIYRAVNKIDLSPYKTLYMEGVLYSSDSSNAWRTSLRVWSEFGTYAEDNTVASILGSTSKSSTVHSVDISEVEGECYIGFSVYGSGNYATMKKLWAE